MIHQRLSLLIIILCCVSQVFAQELAIEGFVFTEGQEPAEMASVALYKANNGTTSQVDAVAYADKKGFYHIDLVPPLATKYILRAQYVGYKLQEIIIPRDSLRGIVQCNFLLDELSEANQLSEVKVTAKRKVGFDRQSYHFTSDQIKLAQSSIDLALMIPQIKADARTGRIVSAIGDLTPTILINGHYGTNEELRSIPPHKIIRIDYYDIAPERYNTRGAVLDVITKPLDNGHHAGAEGSIAPFAVDGVARLFYNYNTGPHQLKFFSSHFLRHTLCGKKEEQETEYTAADRWQYRSEGTTHTRLNSNVLKASYVYSVPNKQYFEASLSSMWEKSKLPQVYNAMIRMNDEQQLRQGVSESYGFAFTPVADIYYDRTLSHIGNRISSNVVYTHNQTNSIYSLAEHKNSAPEPSLKEEVTGKTIKNSVIAQIEYLHPVKGGWLYAGTNFMYTHARFAIKGHSSGKSEDAQYQYRDRIYFTWEANKGKLFWRISPAANLQYISEHNGVDKPQMHLNFNPRLLIGYNLPHNQRIRWEVETADQTPDLGSTTEVMRQLREDLFVRNNPNLQNSYLATTRLYYSWQHSHIDLSSTLIYSYTDKDWITSFDRTDIGGRTVIVQQQSNAINSQYAMLKAEVRLKPLGSEQLSIRLYAHPRYDQYQLTKDQAESLFSIPSGASIAYRQNSWGVQGDIALPYKSLRSYFTSSSGWYSALSGFWSKGSWNLRIALENLFVPEESQTINHSFLNLHEHTHSVLRDNLWKASISVSYYFSVGKNYQGTRHLENEDNDRGDI